MVGNKGGNSLGQRCCVCAPVATRWGINEQREKPQKENLLLLFLFFLGAQTPTGLNKKTFLDHTCACTHVCLQVWCKAQVGTGNPQKMQILDLQCPLVTQLLARSMCPFLSSSPESRSPISSSWHDGTHIHLVGPTRTRLKRQHCQAPVAPQRDGRHPPSPHSPPHHLGFSTLNISTSLIVPGELSSFHCGARCLSPGSRLQTDRDRTGPLHAPPQISARLPHRPCTHKV